MTEGTTTGTTEGTTGDLDRIERQIEIAAPASRVWELIATPGWFINDGAVIDHRIERRGDLAIVHDPVHGSFPIRTERLDPPRYAAFRWLNDESENTAQPAGSTLIEFWLDEKPDGGVTLRGAESGFASLPGSAQERRRRLDENSEGWETELAAARSFLDLGTVERSRHIAATPEQVWPFLTRAEHFATWYAFDGATFDAVPGSMMELHWAEHGTFRGRVVQVDEPHRFAYRIAAASGIDPEPDTSTLVTFQLRKSGDGCLLTVTQSGFDGLAPRFGPVAENVATEESGWETGLTELAERLPTAPANR